MSNWREVNSCTKSVKGRQREKSEAEFECLSLSLSNKSLLGYPAKMKGWKKKRQGREGLSVGCVISAEGFLMRGDLCR